MQVVRAFPTADGAALVHLHNVSGGILGGDRLRIGLEIEPGASAQLTTTGATRLYRSRDPQEWAEQTILAKVGADGLLEHLPDALIPFAGAHYRQHCRIELGPGAGLLWWEILAAGRVARGERFAYHRLDLNVEVWAGAEPVVLDRARLEPALRPPGEPGRLGSYNYLASFYLCKIGWPAEEWRQLERELAPRLAELTSPGECQWGVSTLAAHGLSLRGLSRTGRELLPALYEIWSLARPRLFGRSCPPPRKVY